MKKKSSMSMKWKSHTHTSYLHFASEYELAISYFILQNFESMNFFFIKKNGNEVYQPNTWMKNIYVIVIQYTKQQRTSKVL